MNSNILIILFIFFVLTFKYKESFTLNPSQIAGRCGHCLTSKIFNTADKYTICQQYKINNESAVKGMLESKCKLCKNVVWTDDFEKELKIEFDFECAESWLDLKDQIIRKELLNNLKNASSKEIKRMRQKMLDWDKKEGKGLNQKEIIAIFRVHKSHNKSNTKNKANN